MVVRDRKLWRHVVIFALAVLALGVAHQWVNPWLRYDRAALAAGQGWRLWSAHVSHLNTWHTVMNLAGLVLIVHFFRDLLDRYRFWSWLVFCGLFSSVALYLLDPGLDWYVGLSGLLHALLVFCLLLGWRGHPWLHSLVLAVVTGRLLVEQWPGYDVDYLRGWIGGSVYVNAHLYGAISGVFLMMGVTGFERSRIRHKER